MKKLLGKILKTGNYNVTIIIRLMVGLVFLSEGIQKFLFPEALGVGRFIHIGIPYPHFFAPFTGFYEIFCGLLVIVGLFTRLSAIPLLIINLVAIISTKIPMLFEKGIWVTAHEGRTDFCMFCGIIILLIIGSGKFSIDYKLQDRYK